MERLVDRRVWDNHNVGPIQILPKNDLRDWLVIRRERNARR